MLSYRALLDQLALHSIPQLQQLKHSKVAYDRLTNKLTQTEKQININTSKIKSDLILIEQNAIYLLKSLDEQIKGCLAKNRSICGSVIQCGCGFETQSTQQYVEHLQQVHKSLRYVKGSTHFATFFGNVVKCDSLLLRNFQDNKTKPKHLANIPQKPLLNQRAKTKNKRKEIKSIQEIKNHHEQKSKNKSIDNVIKPNLFRCGQCYKQFDQFKLYTLHMRSHDFMVHPNSSHIIIRRRKGQNFMYLAVDQKNTQDKFFCPCKTGVSFSKDEFVAHAFKWHKGIVPKK